MAGVYDANGNHLSESAYGNRFLWQGREYSYKTGLYYFRARWYDPVMGRWLSNDPIGISGGSNQYVFCANNPINFRDPLGLWNIWAGTWGVANGVGWDIWDSLNPIHESAGWSDAWDGAVGGLAASVDGFIPFGDPFQNAYADECGNVEGVYQFSQVVGGQSIGILVGGGVARGATALGGTRFGYLLNHNRYLRIGPGNIPRGRPWTYGPGQGVPTLRIGNGAPSTWNHFDLRILGH